MTITLTEEQYRTLVSLVHLGNWMINSYRDLRKEEYDEVEQAVLARSPAFKADDLVRYDVKEKRWHPAREFEEELRRLVDEYDLDTFYEELTHGLAHRDMFTEIGEEECKAMSDEEFGAAEMPYLERYDEEFETYGIERLAILEKGVK